MNDNLIYERSNWDYLILDTKKGLIRIVKKCLVGEH
jgi:hypothetical protein